MSEPDPSSGAPTGPATEASAGETGADTFAAAVVHSKVRAPALRPATLERPRLLAWLEDRADSRLRLLIAEAGYGKSTLLADHARRFGRRTAWYRLDSTDRDWVTFINYIVASVRELVPGFAPATVALLQQVGVLDPSRDVVFDTLLAELEPVARDSLTLILDDFHLVADGPDVRAMVMRLLEAGPSGLSVVIAGRDRPPLPLSRLTSQGVVAELTTDQLKFTRRETAALFAESNGTPLDDELVNLIDERLEGWVASLQLICASLISLHPDEIRAFIRNLSAHSEPLYEFLAEEVLGRQTPVMRRVLTHASIVARISPHLVAAATADPHAVSMRQITVCLGRAEEVGLIGRAATRTVTWRVHPLVREFLAARLVASLTRTELLAMHLRIAVAAESSDWLTAAHHYLEADHPDDAMRVLRQSAIEALGTATWGEAMELVQRSTATPPPIASVIQARSMIADGEPDAALAVLGDIDPEAANSLEHALAGLTRAAALFAKSQADDMIDALHDVTADSTTPEEVRGIADAWLALIGASGSGPLGPTAKVVMALAEHHKAKELWYFAAISLNNAMFVELTRGNYVEAVTLGRDALEQVAQISGRIPETASFHSTLAHCLAESGRFEDAWVEVDLALRADNPQPDALAEAAWLAAIAGRTDMASSCLRRADRRVGEGYQELGADILLTYVEAMLAIMRSDTATAESLLRKLPSWPTLITGDLVRRFLFEAMVAVSGNRSDAIALADDGLALARSQGAWRWEFRLQVVRAIAGGDREELPRLVADATASQPLALLELADLLSNHIDLLGDKWDLLDASIQAFPGRWLPALRRSLGAGGTPAARGAAKLLARHGIRSDLVVLSAWEQTYGRPGKQRQLAAVLSKRVTPVLTLRDLGRTEFIMESKTVVLSQVRRRAAALLLYLASKPGHSAPREQLLDELWPDAGPRDALNSLHQALYYLRRSIDEWYEEITSADYVVLESEIVYLDSSLVVIESAEFAKDASATLLEAFNPDRNLATINLYRGAFAPEFEYEEWAIDYRTRIHALYLRLVQATADSQLAGGANEHAVLALSSALRLDPTAFELEGQLVRALWAQGSRAAAWEHYRHYSHAHDRELGLTAPTFQQLVGQFGERGGHT